jgi:hypothetical protein
VNPSLVMPMAIGLVLLAPAASIVTATQPHAISRTWRFALLAIAVLSAVSLGARMLSPKMSADGDWRTIAVAHTTLTAAAIAFATLGALCARLCRDVLDAAAVSTVLALAVSFALLLAGDLAGQLPIGIVDAGLVASPFVAVASAANIDILRDDTWYRLSPIAHRSFNYPVWYEAVGSYAIVSLGCAAAFIWKTKRAL